MTSSGHWLQPASVGEDLGGLLARRSIGALIENDLPRTAQLCDLLRHLHVPHQAVRRVLHGPEAPSLMDHSHEHGEPPEDVVRLFNPRVAEALWLLL